MPPFALSFENRKSTFLAPHKFTLADIAQLGERQTEDLKVPGSIPGVGNLFWILFLQCEQVVGTRTSYHGILAEWLRRLIRNQLGTFPREFESLRCRFLPRVQLLP